MALQLIAGRSGSGKSRFIYDQIIARSLEEKEERFFVMVPDQFTMQTQKELVRLHPAHSIMNIDVLSFSRLAYRVFDEVGFDPGLILEDMGKTLILQKILWDNQNALSVLSGTMKKPGGVTEMKSLLSEFMEYRIAPADLAEAAAEGSVPPLLSAKLSDLRLVYEKLKERLSGTCLAAEEVCEALSGVIGRSERLKGSTVVFDGFTGFVPVQLPVMRELLKIAKDVIVVLTADPASGLIRRSSPADLFHLSHKTAAALAAMASEEGVQIRDTIWIDSGEGRFMSSPALRFLERNLFRTGRESYPDPQGDIRIICAENKEEEIACAASVIHRLIRTEGLRFRDFAVICADLGAYGEPMKLALDACDIPAFLDEKHPVLDDPFAQFVRGAVGMIADDFSYDSVFAYLRSGLSGLDTSEVDRMENYVLAAGVRGLKRYRELWTRTPKTYRTEDLPELNALRERFLSELDGLITVFKTRMSTVRAKTEALYSLCVSCGLQEKLKGLETAFALAGDKQREKEYSQIYKAVMDLFDKLIDILGEERIGVAAYVRLIETGFDEMRIGVIPTGPDEVVIGDIERSRVKNRSVMLFLGLNDGNVPKRAARAGLLNEKDRDVLTAHGMTLAPSEKEEMYTQRFYLYLNLTMASEKICLLYRRTDESGAGLLPSYLIGTVARMFPEIETETFTFEDRLETAPGRKTALIAGLTGNETAEDREKLQELILGYRGDPGEEAVLETVLRGMGVTKKEAQIDPETAEAIYEDRYSVTRLQLFAGCAFAHFCRYGLKLEERQVWQAKAADIGSVYHLVMKNFFTLATEQGGVAGLTEKKRNELADRAFDMAIGAQEGAVLLDSNRSRALTRRLRRILRRVLGAVQRQLEEGEFVTEGVETPYRLGKLSGVIDRYDVCRIGDTAYVRVIDYKSSETKIDFTKLYAGLQIQLPVYLNAAVSRLGREENARAAGIYYLAIRAPLVKAESMREEISYEEFLKQTQFRGLTLDDPLVLEKTESEPGRKLVIPVRIKKDGTPYKDAPVIPEGDFRLIGRYVKRLVEDLEEAIRRGSAQISPAAEQPNDSGACRFCAYKGICGFDEKIPGCEYRILPKLTQKTVFPAMSSRLREGEEV